MAGHTRASKRLAAALPPGATAELYVRGQARSSGKKDSLGIALTSSGVALVSVRAFDARPKHLIALVPVEALAASDPDDERTVSVAGTAVRLAKKDRRRLLQAAAGRHTAAFPPASPGWYPLEGTPAAQGYWDGETWRAVGRWQDGTWIDLRLPAAAPAPTPA